MNFSLDNDASIEAPINLGILDVEVVPPRLWIKITLPLHNSNGLRITEGLLQNLQSNAIPHFSSLLGDS